MNKITLVYYHKNEIDELLKYVGSLAAGRFKELNMTLSEENCMYLVDKAEKLLSAATDGAYTTIAEQQTSEGGSALKSALLAKHSQTLTRIHNSIDSIHKSALKGAYEAVRTSADKIYPVIMDFCTMTDIKVTAPSGLPNSIPSESDDMEQLLTEIESQPK